LVDDRVGRTAFSNAVSPLDSVVGTENQLNDGTQLRGKSAVILEFLWRTYVLSIREPQTTSSDPKCRKLDITGISKFA